MTQAVVQLIRREMKDELIHNGNRYDVMTEESALWCITYLT
jgi:hypothetical protein